MAPFRPHHNSAGQDIIHSFGGILATEFLPPPPGRGFCFRQTYRAHADKAADQAVLDALEKYGKPSGPPPHLHRYQAEYFKVEQGVMSVNVNGKIITKTPADPEFSIPANEFHGFFRHPDSEGPMTVVLSATDSGRDYVLDRVFFENWYGYWHDAMIYDAGDAYPFVPSWVPFRRALSYCWGVAVGRWLGGMLGYRPFFREYTTDWELAQKKMDSHFWLRG